MENDQPNQGENESIIELIEDLKNSPNQTFAQVIINEIKALQERYVILRLDRDNWKRDYGVERDMADRLFDVLSASPSSSSEEFEQAKNKQALIHEYRLRRGGHL
ncbi:MAG: hypothetical protein VKL42_19445 [Snowella sp.]|nr:hypothetical protein [Snowella sp.]